MNEEQTSQGKAEPNPEWEARARAFREEVRRKAQEQAEAEGEPIIDPAGTLVMLERWTADAEPANEHGQITFSRAMLESAEDALRFLLSEYNELRSERDRLREALEELVELTTITWPALESSDPIKKARAALGDEPC